MHPAAILATPGDAVTLATTATALALMEREHGC